MSTSGGTASGAKVTALVALVRDAARLDRTQSDPLVSLRNAVGVGAPLAIGALMGSASIGLPSTIGALQTAFADRPGPYRLRIMRMAGTAGAAAVTSGLAVLLSRSAIASAGLLLVIGFVAGLLVCAGPSATQVGIASTATALIIGHAPQSPAVALHVGLLVFVGGLGQTLLAVAGWPLRRHRPERVALAGLYRELAAVARRPPGTHVGPPLGDRLATVRQTLYGLGHDHGPSVEAYRVLLDEAERIRGELIVLAGQAERLGHRQRPDEAGAVTAVMLASASALDEIAMALEVARPVDEDALTPVRVQVRSAVDILDNAGLSGRAAAARVRSLSGQLRAAIETTRAGASEGGRGEAADEAHGVARLRDPVAILRANLTLNSAVLRHAIRIAVLVAGSDLVMRLVGVQRGYWVPLTILVTLRPDFATTFQRSSMRVTGTIVGLVLATVLIHFVPGGEWWSIALVALFFFGVRFAGPGNIALVAIALAALVVVLLSLAGVSPHTTVLARGLDTLIGGALALAAALLWPAWERQRVPARLVTLLDAYRDCLLALGDASADEKRLQRLRAAARLARSNAQTSVDTARAEPVSSRGQVELGETVLAHTHRFAHALLMVEAVRPALLAAGPPPQLQELWHRCERVLVQCARAIAADTAPRHVPNLRTAQEDFAALARADPARVGGAEAAGALLDATDRIANSLDTLTAELRRQHVEPAAITSRS